MQIENKVFIVTGGASGLGAATAELLVAAGAKVMLVDMNADAAASLTPSKIGHQVAPASVERKAPTFRTRAWDGRINSVKVLVLTPSAAAWK